MATSAEDKLHYILAVLSHTDLPRPDFNAVAIAKGISSANNAQKKFKAYIEQAGYKLKDNQVIGSEDEDARIEKPETPKKSAKKRGPDSIKKSDKEATLVKKNKSAATKTPNRSTKKRKIEEVVELSDDDDAEVGEIVGDAQDTVEEGVKAEDAEQTSDEQDAGQQRYDSDRGRSMTVKPEETF